MAFRDLLFKIVPTKVVIRELKTSSGKVLTKDSEYTLVEKKKYVTVGKKTHVDYVFELDLKQDSDKLNAQQQEKAKEEERRKQNVFYLNFEDFSIVKLRSMVFFLYFPITFTLSILTIWLKLVPNPNAQKEGAKVDYTKEEIEGMTQCKALIKEFTHSLAGHLKSLHDYFQSVIDEKPLQLNFTLIKETEEFKEFRDVFGKTKHTGLTQAVAEEFFLQTFQRIEESMNKSIQ